MGIEIDERVDKLDKRVDGLDGRVGSLESRYDGLDTRVESLEKWMPIVLQDNKESIRLIHERIGKMDDKMDKVTDTHRDIVRDASSRVPKWAMWLFGTLTGLLIVAILAAGGWVVQALMYHK